MQVWAAKRLIEQNLTWNVDLRLITQNRSKITFCANTNRYQPKIQVCAGKRLIKHNVKWNVDLGLITRNRSKITFSATTSPSQSKIQVWAGKRLIKQNLTWNVDLGLIERNRSKTTFSAVTGRRQSKMQVSAAKRRIKNNQMKCGSETDSSESLQNNILESYKSYAVENASLAGKGLIEQNLTSNVDLLVIARNCSKTTFSATTSRRSREWKFGLESDSLRKILHEMWMWDWLIGIAPK